MSKLNYNSAVVGAAKRVRKALDRTQQIRGGIETLLAAQPAAEIALEQTLDRVGAEAAEVLLVGGEEVGGLAQVRDARDRLDALNARLRGLQLLQVQSNEALEVAFVDLEAARNECGQECLTEYLEELRLAAAAFRQVLCRGGALAELFGLGHIESAIRAIKIDGLQGTGLLIDMDARRFTRNGWQPEPCWAEDAAARKLVEGGKEVLDVFAEARGAVARAKAKAAAAATADA